MDMYQEGRKAAKAYYTSQGFFGFTRFVKAEDAIRLFLPPVEEALVQISTPLPKKRQAWVKGFKDQQKELINE